MIMHSGEQNDLTRLESIPFIMADQNSEFIESKNDYNNIFEMFSRGRLQQQQVWVENKLVPKLVQHFTPQVTEEPCSEFRVLSIGTGIGAFDVLLLEQILTNGKQITDGKQIIWTVVEPNAPAIERFKQKVQSDSAMFERVQFVWVNKNVEEFFDTVENPKYHFIHFVHILYYTNEEVVLKNAYERFLESKGSILVVVGSENDIWVNLIKTFKSQIPSLTSELHYPTNIELAEICKNNHWPHETFESKLDLEVTEIHEEGNPQGESMLKFFLHVNEDPRKKFGEELVSDILRFFEKMSWEIDENGKKRFFVNDDEGILLLSKSQ